MGSVIARLLPFLGMVEGYLADYLLTNAYHVIPN